MNPTTIAPLCLSLLATASALRVPYVAMSGATRLGAGDSRPGSVPDMYRERWEDEPADKSASRPADLLSSPNRDGLAAVREEEEEACLMVSEKEVICGEMSFDSSDEMLCIQDPESESVKWICQ